MWSEWHWIATLEILSYCFLQETRLVQFHVRNIFYETSQVHYLENARCTLVCTLQREVNKGLYVVAINFFLLLLNCSAWPCLGPAQQNKQTFIFPFVHIKELKLPFSTTQYQITLHVSSPCTSLSLGRAALLSTPYWRRVSSAVRQFGLDRTNVIRGLL